MGEAEPGDTGPVRTGEKRPPAARALEYLRGLTYVLGALLVLSLLAVGTVGIIAELKGTWHWAIHLESTISFMGVFVAGILAVLLPSSVLLLFGRRVVDVDA
ncbi:MAG: hypothetical protein ABEI80_07475 [Haloplanus sp.]